MNRRFLAVAAFAIWAQWSAAFAQTIEVPALTPLGQPIVAKVELPEGGKVVWKADAGSSVINAGKGRAYLWGTAGGHTVQAVVAPGGDAELLWLEATYAVGDAPPTPPVVVKTLAELAGDKAAILAELLTDLREAALPVGLVVVPDARCCVKQPGVLDAEPEEVRRVLGRGELRRQHDDGILACPARAWGPELVRLQVD